MRPPKTSRTTSTSEHRRSQPRTTRQLKIIQQQVGHSYASTTALYTNPRELHQTSENLQVTWPGWLGRGVPRTRRACA